MTLKDGSGNIIDSYTYSTSQADSDISIQRQADGNGAPTDVWVDGQTGGNPGSGYTSTSGSGTPSEPSPSPPSPSPPAPTPSPPSPSPPTPTGSTVTRSYQAYSLEMKCETADGVTAGYPVRFTYALVGPDLGNEPRPSSFYYDNGMNPIDCQPTSRNSFSHPNCGSSGRKTNPFCFDRGHLVMANHMDNDPTTIYESNYMTNILPQAAGFNQAGGAWILTEEIIECGRDIANVQKQETFGGAIFTDTSNDYWWPSHGIRTPEVFWKVIVRYFNDGTTPDVIAWVMPNDYTSIDDLLDTYLDTVANVQAYTGDAMPELPATYTETAVAAGVSWIKPSGCDLSRRRA